MSVNVVAVVLVCDPELTRLFTPLRPVLGHYEVCTTGQPLGEVARSERQVGAPGEIAEIEEVEPLDAFGAAGVYDRSALARLYGGRRVKVARGWMQDKDRFQSVTLLSPYPDASFTRLKEGTMVIRWVISR